MDQNALNAVLGNHVLYLDMKYNCMYANIKKYTYEQISEYYKINLDEVTEAVNHPVILHLTNIIKPWKTPLADKYEEWVEYVDINALKICISNYYQFVMDEIKRLEEKVDKLEAKEDKR